MSIDRASKRPVYKQIYDVLRAEMDGGQYGETGKLPSEKTLCERFDVERNTVRKALQTLVDEGRIARQRGSGTRILPRFPREPSSGWSGEASGNRIVMLIAHEDYLHSGEVESYHYKLIHSFERRLSELGYHLMFKSVSKDGAVAESIRSASPAAIIFDSYTRSSYHREALQFGIPCVSVNHYTPLMTSIVSNNFDSAYGAVRTLVDAGHKRIAFILGKRSHQTCVERLSGVQSLYTAQGLPLEEEYLFTGNWLFHSGAEAGDRIAALPPARRPSAVFAFNDDMAYGCLSSFLRHGIRVPDEISLVGFDKSDRYGDMFPKITTVDVNLEAMVDYACWVLSDSLAGKAPDILAKIEIGTQVCDNGTIRDINNRQEKMT